MSLGRDNQGLTKCDVKGMLQMSLGWDNQGLSKCDVKGCSK